MAFLVICLAVSPAMSSDRVLTAKEAWSMAREGKVTIIDVRSTAEWRQTGVPSGARKVTIHQPDGGRGFVKAMARAMGGDRARPIALICARGNRSTRAFAILQNAGFTNVYNVREGMLGRGDAMGWMRGGLPVDRCVEC